MYLLSDIITYVRRLVKTPSNTSLSDSLIIDYINRFWLNDVDARIQLFDLKTKYQFQTAPGYDQYNMPVYSVQTESGAQTISYYPVYQGFLGPAYVNGIQVPIFTQKQEFYNIWPNVVQLANVVTTGNGGATYNFTFPVSPQAFPPITNPFEYILRGHVDIQGLTAIANSTFGGYLDPPIVSSANALITIPAAPVANVFPAVYITSNLADGTNVVVSDSGQFLSGNQNYGLLMSPGNFPNGNTTLGGGYSTSLNTVNYFTGEVNVTFPVNIPQGVNINAQCYFFQSGLPRGLLFNNNVITIRNPPDQQYLVELDAYLSPAGFLSTNQSIQFGYMSEYIARGAARKLLSDTGDWEQFNQYEPLFKEQETLVWKRSQRIFTSTRTQTIYSQGINQGNSSFNSIGGSAV